MTQSVGGYSCISSPEGVGPDGCDKCGSSCGACPICLMAEQVTPGCPEVAACEVYLLKTQVSTSMQWPVVRCSNPTQCFTRSCG